MLFLTRAHCQASNNQVVSWEALPWPRSPVELPHHHRLVPGRAEDSVGVKGTGDLPGTRRERLVHLPSTRRAQHSCVVSEPKMCRDVTGESWTFQVAVLDAQLLKLRLLLCRTPAQANPDTGTGGTSQPEHDRAAARGILSSETSNFMGKTSFKTQMSPGRGCFEHGDGGSSSIPPTPTAQGTHGDSPSWRGSGHAVHTATPPTRLLSQWRVWLCNQDARREIEALLFPDVADL